MGKNKTGIVKDYFKSIGKWIDDNRFEFAVLILILLVGAFFRLYRINEFMTFLGDEGRDVIVVRRLLVDRDLVFVGPGTSVGDMYLGPIYYYLMAPPLFLANYSPVGPAVQIALLGVITIFFVWYVTRKWFGKTASIIASLLYAISPVVIYYSRSSWNPNIMPFFALLAAYSLWKIWREDVWGWLLVLGVSFGVVLQSHYLGLILFPFILIYWLLAMVGVWRKKKKRPIAIKYSLFAFFIFVILIFPLALFDAKHNWRNISSMRSFFVRRADTLSLNLTQVVGKMWPIFVKMITRLITATDEYFGRIFSVLIAFGAVGMLVKIVKNKDYKNKAYAYVFIISWIVISVIGLSLYREEIYDHYLGFVFPAPFILAGALIGDLVTKKNIVGKLIAILLVTSLVAVNLVNNPLKKTPNNQLNRSITVSKKIVEEAGGDAFNFAVIADENYEGAYIYFLEAWDVPIVMIDPQRADATTAKQLFVVCEYEEREQCQPTSNPKAQVANFGWSKIEKQWEVGGVLLFRLVHNKPDR